MRMWITGDDGEEHEVPITAVEIAINQAISDAIDPAACERARANDFWSASISGVSQRNPIDDVRDFCFPLVTHRN